MPFSLEERQALLALKGVGEVVLSRLESIGLDSFDSLKTAEVDDVLLHISQLLKSTCWRNSPQARKAIQDIIHCAQMS